MKVDVQTESYKSVDQKLRRPSLSLDDAHRQLYDAHVAYWRELIESGDLTVYSSWTDFAPVYMNGQSRLFDTDVDRLNWLLGNKKYQWYSSALDKYPSPGNIGWPTRFYYCEIRTGPSYDDMQDNTVRLAMMKRLLNAYCECIERRVGGGRLDVSQRHDFSHGGLGRNDLVDFVQRVHQSGYNPFDLLYYFKSPLYKRWAENERRVSPAKIAFGILLVGLAIVLLEC